MRAALVTLLFSAQKNLSPTVRHYAEPIWVARTPAGHDKFFY
jgi:hypothetical protein